MRTCASRSVLYGHTVTWLTADTSPTMIAAGKYIKDARRLLWSTNADSSRTRHGGDAGGSNFHSKQHSPGSGVY